MISIDYLSDLGLKGVSSNDSSSGEDIFNIVVDYIVDSNSTNVKLGDLLTFAGNNVKKAGATDVINAIAIESGEIGTTVKCQIIGIVSIPNHFIAGKSYYNNGGVLSTVANDKNIGLAITKDELLLKEGVFIHV